MAKKPSLEEFEKQFAQDLEFYSSIDKQVENERNAENEKLSNMTEEERLNYLWEKDKKNNLSAQGKFNESLDVKSKKKKD